VKYKYRETEENVKSQKYINSFTRVSGVGDDRWKILYTSI